MKRPSGTVIAIALGFTALVIIEVILWWPDAPKKADDSAPPPEPTPTAAPAAPPVPEGIAEPAPRPSAARAGQNIRKLEEDPEAAQIRELQSCRGKRCGEPCVLRCDPEDGRCTPAGVRPGACTVDGDCSYILPAVCP